MLFHRVAEGPRSDVFLEQIVFVLPERLDLSAFREAWRENFQRHEVFRSTFDWNSDQPRQHVQEDAFVDWQQLDWSHLSQDEQNRRWEELLQTDRGNGFQLDRLPLSRVTAVQCADELFRILWSFHHIQADGRSFTPLISDLFAHYEAIKSGQPVSLPPTRPYANYIEWLERQDSSRNEPFWRAELAGFKAATPLPGARPADPNEKDRGPLTWKRAAVSTGVLERLSRQGRAYGFTLNNCVQAAWAALLSRFGGGDDIVFGAVRACRRPEPVMSKDAVGMFMNTVPFRVKIPDEGSTGQWIRQIALQQKSIRDYELAPLVDVQSWSEVPAGSPLFETAIVFDYSSLGGQLRSLGGLWEKRSFELIERTNYPLTLYAEVEGELWLKLSYDPTRFDDSTITRLLASLVRILEGIAEDASVAPRELPVMSDLERTKLLEQWNDTKCRYANQRCIHQLIEDSARTYPDRTAITCQGNSLTYSQLNARANVLARQLVENDVRADRLVGVFLNRSIDLVVATLAVMKAGGAYVPLDPEFPRDRLAFMLQDANVNVVITDHQIGDQLPTDGTELIFVDDTMETGREADTSDLEPRSQPGDLAYVIYTSGSTGKPKGVMVEHRNVSNFFTGMDQRIPRTSNGKQDVWLAVTSLSFDISVLELFWTLARGMHVVLHADEVRGAKRKSGALPSTSKSSPPKPIDFGLFYFASDDGQSATNKYRLLMEGARFADERGFHAVWTPERHFHEFGGLYPNPAVTGAAIAACTKRVKIRAGSVVLPLHHPIRVAEEWSVVDNLSHGRVEVSVAAGWQPNDFVLAPESYKNSKNVMFERLDVVRRLWKGEAVSFPGARDDTVDVRTLPRPVQPELPVWITTAGNIDTYRQAGSSGSYVLTHLLGQTVEELREKIDAYRQARRDAGIPGEGRVALMLHTFVGDDIESVRDTVRRPMIEYLRTAFGLVKNLASAWTAFKRNSASTGTAEVDVDNLSQEELDDLLEFSFDRYFETSGLFGTPESCLEMVRRIGEMGVDEIGCLIDFGIDHDLTLDHLEHLDQLRQLVASGQTAWESYPATTNGQNQHSIENLIRQHGVTHLQCTPSMASMLLLNEEARSALPQVGTLMIGGEAFPRALATELCQMTDAKIINMYGPTETTIWSSTEEIRGEDGAISIGRPIANTQLYVLDRLMQPVPVGVVGDLYIGGEGVVRGYLNRPELTNDRFLPNPFAEDESRIYRTGDLASFREDGRVDFLGRVDHQVKIRGHRIELGEIETDLTEEPTVREAVVVAREDTPGDQRLVAYLIPEEHAAADVDMIRTNLRNKLPEYMVPGHFVVLDEFPMTPNKKVDRKALPRPDERQAGKTLATVLPENETHNRIAEIWQKNLGIAQVGIDENFFDLGGHSLLAVKVHREIKDAFSCEISITDLFRFPTIDALANHLNVNEAQTTTGGTEATSGSATERAGTRLQRRSARQERLQKRRSIRLRQEKPR